MTDDNLIKFKANSRTHERRRKAREQERMRLIRKIGIRPEDAPLFSEELRFMVYQMSKSRG